MPKVSVLMSVYNTKEEWLKESIESILNQTFSDFEFIILDDGSTSNIKKIISFYNDERIKYVYQNNQGLANSLNNGLKIVKGEYVARMDSDDISLPHRLKKQVDCLNNHPEISICGSWFEIFPETKIIKHPPYPKYMELMQYCCIAHPTVMFRKQDLKKYNLKYNPEYKCEDYELWSRAIRYLKFHNIQEVLLKYRIHGSNLSTPTKEFIADDKKVKQNMLDFLTDDKDLQKKLTKVLYPPEQTTYSIWEWLFSIKNSSDKRHKIITITGIRIKLHIRKKNYITID